MSPCGGPVLYQGCGGEAWEMCWVGLKFKGQGPGLTKIHFPSTSPLTCRFLRGQNSIESKPEDGLEHGSIGFGCKQLSGSKYLRIMGSDLNSHVTYRLGHLQFNKSISLLGWTVLCVA